MRDGCDPSRDMIQEQAVGPGVLEELEAGKGFVLLRGGDGSKHLEDAAAGGKQRALQKPALWYLKRWWFEM